MKKYLLASAASLLMSTAAFAQLGENGYYRVQNNATSRYVGIIHDRSETEVVTTQADLNALRAYKNWDWVESDPATIIFIEKKSSGTTNGKTYYNCNLHGQGTNTYSIINYDIKILDMGGKYRCYVVYNGTQYLSELSESSSAVVNKLNINNSSTWDWNILPVSSSGSNYFGVKPTVTADGKYYATMYAHWGFTPVSASTKAYYVEKVENGYAVIRQISGAVPAVTPVIFECAGATAADNKLDIAINSATLPSANKLSGVYFCIDNGQSFHKDYVAYDPATMRVLGVCSDGRPGFIKKDVSDFTVPHDFRFFMAKGAIPPNTAYLKVPSGTPDELPLITAEEYAAGINGVTIDGNVASNITTLSGTIVRKNATSTAGLCPGVYIWNKKKIVVK